MLQFRIIVVQRNPPESPGQHTRFAVQGLMAAGRAESGVGIVDMPARFAEGTSVMGAQVDQRRPAIFAEALFFAECGAAERTVSR